MLVLMLASRPFSRSNKHSYAGVCAYVASENQAGRLFIRLSYIYSISISHDINAKTGETDR